MLLPLSLCCFSVHGREGVKYNRSPPKAEARTWVYAMTIQYGQLMRRMAGNIKQNGGNVGLCLAAVSFLLAGTSCRKQVAPASDDSAVRPTANVITEVDRLYAGRGDLIKVRQGVPASKNETAAKQRP